MKAWKALKDPDLKKSFIKRLEQVQIYKTMDAT